MSNELSARFEFLAGQLSAANLPNEAVAELIPAAEHPELQAKMAEVAELVRAEEDKVRALAEKFYELADWTVPEPPPPPPPPPPPEPPPPPVAPKPVVTEAGLPRYRTHHRRLFSGTDVSMIPPRIGGTPFSREAGPTWNFVSVMSQGASGYTSVGPWKNAGGDWEDITGTPQGSQPFASMPLNAVNGSTLSHTYRKDILPLVQKVQSEGRALAIYMTRTGTASRPLASRFSADGTANNPLAPKIIVGYRLPDGGVEYETLPCLVMGSLIKDSNVPRTTISKLTMPIMAEFQPPQERLLVSAEIEFTVLEHWSGSAVWNAFLVKAPNDIPEVELGIAAAAPRDASLDSDEDILGHHSCADGTVFEGYAFTAPGPTTGAAWNTGAENNFDPAIFDTGPQNLNLLPHVSGKKWVNARFQGDCDLVPSTYDQEGFKCLAPGIGAMRWKMDREVFADGDVVGYTGTAAAHAKIFLPDGLFGRCGLLYIRYYFRIGTMDGGDYEIDPPGSFQVRQSAGGSLSWTGAGGGKFGIMGANEIPDGGVSGSSGGGYGHQMRLGWQENDYPGPDHKAWNIYPHLHDFQAHNPPGYRYGSGDPLKGGKHPELFASALYAHRWYCLEALQALNTVMPESPGFLPDGILALWLDGRPAYRAEEVVFRSLPINIKPFNPSTMRNVREGGLRELWHNWFHGGTRKSTRERVVFTTALAWGKKYIGPMCV